MEFDVRKLKWTREPADYSITKDKIDIVTNPHTDLWQRTYYHFRNDNAPVLQMETDEKYFSFIVKTEFESKNRFDQCGIVMYLDSENWLKGSIEYENDKFQHLGSVVTNNGYSDWATTEIDANIKSMWYRFSRRENDYCIECSEDGITFKQMRVCHMWNGNGKIQFGIYACSPENSSFKATFTNMKITECKWLAHDGQQPDEEYNTIIRLTDCEEYFMKKVMNPRFMMVTSMVIFGTLGPFVRNISVSSGELALYRAVLATLLIAIFLLITKQRIPFTNIKKEVPLLLLSGIAMGINWILLFEAYKYTTVSVATLSYYFAPVIVTIVCPILFKEKLTRKQILCFVMSTLGLVMITGIGDMGGGNDFIGILFGLGAAVFYASVILLNKFIKNVEDIHRTFLQFLSAVVTLTPYVVLTSGVTLGHLDSVGWVNLLIVGLVHTGVTYCMYFASLKELPGQKAAILSYIDPLVAVLISITILGEIMNFWQVLGGILILGFTLWNEISLNNTD